MVWTKKTAPAVPDQAVVGTAGRAMGVEIQGHGDFGGCHLCFHCSTITMSDKAAKRARFEGVFDTIAEELLAYLKGEGMPAEAIEWYKKVGAVTPENNRAGTGWCLCRSRECGLRKLTRLRRTSTTTSPVASLTAASRSSTPSRS
jgi:hypothetical protein